MFTNLPLFSVETEDSLMATLDEIHIALLILVDLCSYSLLLWFFHPEISDASC